MASAIDYDDLDSTLRRCRSNWNAGQAHGMLCGQLAVSGASGGASWLALLLEDAADRDQLPGDCADLLDQLTLGTYRQLSERLSEFAPLLPGDGAPMATRTEAMGHWCEGFLHGLVSTSKDETLRKRLAAEPLSEIIKDLLEITRAAVDNEAEQEVEDEAFEELFEYLRVAAQLVYEELAECRDPQPDGSNDSAGDQVLH
jgi:uncharacterized protein YgfB (UPF0149 family)